MAKKVGRTLRLVVVGGGTGSFTLLQSLKGLTPNIAAVVNMCDDGGSTGVLRDELGVLPPGDARQCLVALSESPEIRNLFDYRFQNGRLSGQSLGNIILSGLELQYGSFDKAVEVASHILRIRGTVLPVALGNYRLVLSDGENEVHGQYTIRTHKIAHSDARVRLEPASLLNPKAYHAIMAADLIVIAPGDVYGSLLPVFAVNGIAEALENTSAPIISVTNLINKPGQNDGWHVVDYIKKFEEYIGPGRIDTVLYNTEEISSDLLLRYAAEGEFPVSTDPTRFKEMNEKITFIGAPLVSHEIMRQDPADKAIRRTLIRHDAQAVKEEIRKLLSNQ